ncbi:MAG: type VI secretion system Vgr family protein [Shimia sp.]
MDGSEELSGQFEWRVEALSEDAGIDLHGLLGTHATVEIDSPDGTRSFDGIVCEARGLGGHENGFRYDLVLRPWLHLAGLRRNMRIFHEKTVVEIVQEVLADYATFGAPHMEDRLVGDYPSLEYTVQYGESDADFVRRQLERHGISWAWRCEPGNHTLLLLDTSVSLPKIPGDARPFFGALNPSHREEEHFSSWTTGDRITTGAVKMTEYNFKKPMAAQVVDQLGDASHAAGDIESYEWPGDYLDQTQGKDVSQLRLDAERGQGPRHFATGDVASLASGCTVRLDGDDVPGASAGRFICLSAQHRFRAQAYGSGGAEGEAVPYEGSYVLMPEDTPLRPERRTKRPFVSGPETAVVVGQGEIDCDAFGRILCQFHWDGEGARTMRVRVSQSWASKGWGGMVIPRIGMEVIVEHLRGDPDKPIVTGCVFNGRNAVPYDLPAHKTRSTFRTDTHEGEGFNELRFEDQSGREEIFVHAQKDMNIEVLNDRTKRVEADQTEVVGHDKSIQVGNDHSEVISGNMSIAVGANPLSRTLMNKTQVLFSKMGGIMEKVKVPDVLNFAKGNMQVFIEKNKSEIVNVASSEIVGVAKSTVVGQSFQQTVGKAMSTLVRGRWESDVGQVQVMRVGDQITIQVGENSTLTMSKEGDIVLKGKHIRLEADKIDMN